MRYLLTLLFAALSLNVVGQINPNYNPDYDADGFISVNDVLGVLSTFGDTWDSGDVIIGCTYPAAVEYNSSANVDDGSCTFPIDCAGVINGTSVIDECGVCGGDNSSCAGCDGVAYSGLVYDECGVCGGDNSTCYTGCGDGIMHDGHDYSTVLIGEQCWFAENCRYLPDVDYYYNSSYTSPYYYVYGYDGTNVAAAKETSNYDTYGVLYNWPAVMTDGICPSGWHIPTDLEWQTMEMALGMSDSEASSTNYRGTDQGYQMKSTSGWISTTWANPPIEGNGSNSSGFTGLPGGQRSNNNGFQNL